MTLREKAEAVAKLAADCEGCNDPICQIRLRMGADAIESVAREFAADALRGCFEARRNSYEPVVYIYCKHRYADGNELIQDDRGFDRLDTAQKTIDAFVKAAIKAAAEGK